MCWITDDNLKPFALACLAATEVLKSYEKSYQYGLDGWQQMNVALAIVAPRFLHGYFHNCTINNKAHILCG